MSGGHFDYQQYRIEDIATSIEKYLDENEHKLAIETVNRFREGVDLLRKAAIYAQRIDWFVSGDDGEESFHRRLREDLTIFDRKQQLYYTNSR
jgi:hypothetical protein